jgi:translocation and assembly module TamA
MSQSSSPDNGPVLAARRKRKWRAGIGARLGLALLAAGLSIITAYAADPQTYTVALVPTGNSALDAALVSTSQLQSLRAKAPVGPFALVTRAKDDIGRLDTVLQSFGYYQGKVVIEIDGHPLDDPNLAELLDEVPKGTSVEAKVAIEPGPLFHLGKITIDGAVTPVARAKLGLVSGQPAVATDVLAAGARLLTELQEEGYALAKVPPPIAIEDPQAHVLDVTFKVDEGRSAVIGSITIAGLKEVNESFVRRRLLVRTGQLYQPSKIEAARQDLTSLGVFSGVSVRAAEKIAPDGSIPITFDVQERPRHAVGITGAYSTDLGGSLKTTWSNRNLFGNAEQLNLSAAGTGLGGTDVNGLGYDLEVQLIKPDFLQRDQSLEFDLGAIQQDLEAYSQQAVTAGVSLRRKFSQLWSGSVGIAAEQEQIEQEGVTRDYTLLSLPITAKYDGTGLTDPLQDPTHGVRAAITVTPTQPFGATDGVYLLLQATASTYLDLADLGFGTPGRSVIALRGLVGSAQGASQFDLPPDQRFYGGGSATVRGFKYQSIGPLFPDNNPIGGTAIDAGTIEFRQRLFGDFGAAAFVDAGQVTGSGMPFSGTVRIGTGVGLRYYTPIGPVRLDIAIPVNRPPGGDSFEFYIGLGQAF